MIIGHTLLNFSSQVDITKQVCLPSFSCKQKNLGHTLLFHDKNLKLTPTKWRTDLPEGFACPYPPSMGPIFARRAHFSSSCEQIWNESKIIAWS